jgi:hypothetical protein
METPMRSCCFLSVSVRRAAVTNERINVAAIHNRRYRAQRRNRMNEEIVAYGKQAVEQPQGANVDDLGGEAVQHIVEPQDVLVAGAPCGLSCG